MTQSFRKELYATKAAFYLKCKIAKSNKRWAFKVLTLNKAMKPLRRQNQILILFHQYKPGIAASATAVLT